MTKLGWKGWVLGMVLALQAGVGGAVKPIPDIPKFFPPLFVTTDGVLVAGSSVGLIRSEDAGENWRVLEGVSEGELLAQKDRLLSIGKTVVLSSIDGGGSWQTVGALKDVPWVNQLFRGTYALDERGWLYFCHENVLRVTPDGGVNWRELHPPKGCRLARLGAKTIHVLAAGVVQSSDDGGSTWRVTEAADDAARQAIDGASSLYLMPGRRTTLLAYSNPDGRFHLSENGGRNWRPHGIGFPPDEAVFVVGSTPGKYDDVYFCLLRDKPFYQLVTVYRSADGKSSTPLGLPYSSSPWNLSRGQNNALYVLDIFHIYMSADEGKVWKRLGRGGISPRGYEKLQSLLPDD